MKCHRVMAQWPMLTIFTMMVACVQPFEQSAKENISSSTLPTISSTSITANTISTELVTEANKTNPDIDEPKVGPKPSSEGFFEENLQIFLLAGFLLLCGVGFVFLYVQYNQSEPDHLQEDENELKEQPVSSSNSPLAHKSSKLLRSKKSKAKSQTKNKKINKEKKNDKNEVKTEAVSDHKNDTDSCQPSSKTKRNSQDPPTASTSGLEQRNTSLSPYHSSGGFTPTVSSTSTLKTEITSTQIKKSASGFKKSTTQMFQSLANTMDRLRSMVKSAYPSKVSKNKKSKNENLPQTTESNDQKAKEKETKKKQEKEAKNGNDKKHKDHKK